MTDDGFTAIDDGFTPVTDTATLPAPSVGSRLLSGIGTGAKVGLDALAAPFQILGEAIRGAGASEPLKVATAKDQSGFRAPSIVQRVFPSLKTDEQPADPFQQAVSGLKGAGTLMTGGGLAKANEAIQAKPSMIDALMAMGLAAGTGEAGNAPMTAASKAVSAPAELLGEILHTGELGGMPAGMVAKSATGMEAAPIGLANLTKEAIPEVLKTSQETGVPLTAAGITGSKTQSQIENFFSRLPFSGDVMQNFYANQLSKLGELRDATLPPTRSDQEIGTDIQNAFSDLSQKAYKGTQEAYKMAGQWAGDGPIPTPNLQSKAEELMMQQSKLPSAARASGSGPLLNQLVNPPSPMDYPTLQSLRAELNARIAGADASVGLATPGMKFMSTPEAGIYKQLKAALRQDIDAYAKGNSNFGDALKTADSAYGTFKDLFKNNKYVQGLVRNQNPEAIASQAVKLDNPNAMKILEASLPPNLLNEVRINFLRNMGESTPGVYSPSKFASQYDKIGDDKLGSFLGEPLMNAVRPLYLMSKASGTAEKIAANPSGTAQGMASILGLSAPIMTAIKGIGGGHPIKGIATGAGILGAEMEGLPMMAKAYLSPTATRFLSRQTGMVPSLTPSAVSLGKYANPLLTAIRNAKGPNDLVQQNDDGFTPVQ